MSGSPLSSRPDASERLALALQRIRAPELEGAKVFTAVYEAGARREAEASDRRLAAGAPLGPLDGRIVSIKALFDVAGETTTSGSAVLRGHAAAETAAIVVARLRAAGAIVIGKTQMTEFAFSAVGLNPNCGEPGNPHDRSRVTGGSSSGAVVSVIDGMAEIAIGSDTGGSLRIPAALSGAVGFKPTSGRVPTEGAFSLSSTLDVVGPIALSVDDCALADAVLSGENAQPLRPADRNRFRLIVPRGRLFADVEPEVSAAFERALATLRKAGIRVEDGTLDPELDLLAEIDKIGAFTAIELLATLRDLGITALDGIDPKTRARIEAGSGVAASDYVRMARRRTALVQRLQTRMSDNEAFALPTVPIVAPLLAEVREDAAFHRANGLVLRNPRVANLLDCPSISLPVASSGLPVGLMLIGRRAADHRLLEIASAIEAVPVR
jgi:aspartyl-tRNA(Asn)/glutamyl-tRNA(Gln) amidotransferase subunit A